MDNKEFDTMRNRLHSGRNQLSNSLKIGTDNEKKIYILLKLIMKDKL